MLPSVLFFNYYIRKVSLSWNTCHLLGLFICCQNYFVCCIFLLFILEKEPYYVLVESINWLQKFEGAIKLFYSKIHQGTSLHYCFGNFLKRISLTNKWNCIFLPSNEENLGFLCHREIQWEQLQNLHQEIIFPMIYRTKYCHTYVWGSKQKD